MAKQILKSLNMNFIEEDTGGWASRTVEIRVFDGTINIRSIPFNSKQI
jgi:chemotaxis receptor (MCP) glutamine deamidase CheD